MILEKLWGQNTILEKFHGQNMILRKLWGQNGILKKFWGQNVVLGKLWGQNIILGIFGIKSWFWGENKSKCKYYKMWNSMQIRENVD